MFLKKHHLSISLNLPFTSFLPLIGSHSVFSLNPSQPHCYCSNCVVNPLWHGKGFTLTHTHSSVPVVEALQTWDFLSHPIETKETWWEEHGKDKLLVHTHTQTSVQILHQHRTQTSAASNTMLMWYNMQLIRPPPHSSKTVHINCTPKKKQPQTNQHTSFLCRSVQTGICWDIITMWSLNSIRLRSGGFMAGLWRAPSAAAQLGSQNQPATD